MMSIVVAETCWAYMKYNKIVSSIYLVLIHQLSQWCTVQHTSKWQNNIFMDPYMWHNYKNMYKVLVILSTILFIGCLLNNTLTNSRLYTVSC